ncbi:MAG: hypothetical protein JNL63_05040, partial [Bacteroidia bacterium]|nr:hypothetical protein [Bacteroidia bacterium]
MKYILALFTSLFISHVWCQVIYQPQASGLATKTSPNGYKEKWSTNPVDEKIFIENNGQFDGLLPGHKKVLFSARLGINTDAFFTTEGITYRYIELSKPDENEREQEEKELKSARNTKTHYLSSIWVGINPTVTIESVNKRPDIYIYPSSGPSGIKADLFKKIIYRNLYKGVDAEYFFPQEGGIKYNLIVHPGADVSQIKIKYVGGNKLTKNQSGDIIISSEIGNIVEHAPHSYYKNGAVVSSAFSLNDNVISFRLPDLEVNSQKPINSQPIIIDPWITNLFWYYGGANRGPWDLDCDDMGNVYCIADVGWIKLDNTGNVVWTIPRVLFPSYNSTDIAVDRATGNIYVTIPTGQVLKVSTNGNLLAKYVSTPDFFHEMWRIGWDPCRKKLAIGAGGTGTSNTQAAWTDENLSSMNYVNIEGATKNQHDIAGLAIDPSGSDCYMAASNGQYDTLLNRLIKLPMPTLSPTTWLVWNKYNLAETQSNYYAGPFPWYNNMNILGVSPNWVYMWEGYVLRQFNKATGAINNTLLVQSPKRIPLPSANNPTREACRWSGLAVDLCDNIYAGYKTSINVYNASLSLVNTIPPISNTDTLNDIVLSSDYKTLYSCGSNFVRAIDLTNIPEPVNTTSTPASCNCTGTATTSLNFCSGPVTVGVTYLWDNGQTAATATGLCGGKHFVTLTYNCRPYSDTIIVSAPGGLTITTVQQTNILCHGGNTGSATINVSGGMAPYIYSWSAGGGTGKTVSNLSAGNYTVTVTDASSCKITTIISITEPPSIIAKFTSVNNSCTTTGTASVFVNGGHNPYTYNWSNGSSGPDAYSLSAGNYTVTVIDNIGCTETKAFTITGTNPVSANFTYSPNSPVCYNSTVYFTNTGTPAGAGITHTWTSNPSLVTGSTADYSYTFLTYGTFAVTHTVSNGTCSSSVTKNISIINCNTPNVTVAPATICNGACVTLT